MKKRDEKAPPGDIVLRETEARVSLPATNAAYENTQLSLFQKFLANTDDQRGSLSNAIDLWDSVPRYSVSRQAMTKTRVNGEFLRRHELTFQHRGKTYTRIVSPARITDAEGKERDYYPSASEELVEDALRKLATEKQAGYFDRPSYQSGVVFTLYELREELRRQKHSRFYYEIVESLTILSQSIVEIIPQGKGRPRSLLPACRPLRPSRASSCAATRRRHGSSRFIPL